MSILWLILIVFLVLALIGSVPRWGYSRTWGWGPSGGLLTLVVIVILLALLL